MPLGEVATIRSIERDSISYNSARAGDNVAVTLQGINSGHVLAGGVICHPDYPTQVAKHLELKILVLDISTPILVGSQVWLRNLTPLHKLCRQISITCFEKLTKLCTYRLNSTSIMQKRLEE